ncbi:ABC transporter ATP-binding protein [Pseudolysinimonas kribbensis]|uniref:Nitrate ABC transporter ATP-binding protein n=1 Tax=Pseudolysinimonas kribbensis TaxID=433641 RepID=A0ABQ6K828_9MICO|nr:ABC transporter ATP-binding protein [Pseudolysinimonas kribbensis]GMA96822.1 nitrate ABC transporter ATP-binding protein [Pseudolysinimonas kribbensis]
MSIATATPAIQVTGVTKTFSRPVERSARSRRRGAQSATEAITTGGDVFTALQDIDLSVGKGEFVSLVGASGCGKTTLLRMMSGLIARDSGEIRIDGRLVNGVPSKVGFVFQEPALLPWRSVHDNLAFALEYKQLPPDEREAVIEDKLKLTNLLEFRNSYPHQLSGGMQQRAGLARALATDPEVLFMDEPLSALDAFTRRRLQQEIASIIEASGATCVLVTHDVDEAVFFSDRIVVMGARPGRVTELIDVPFPRPRTQVELLGNPEAAQIRDRVLELVLGLG